jgi:glycosyltransferase involved in cell wall biosynthesis
MQNPFISIIIPVYNGATTLRTCLDSVFQSSYPNFECIVVDDHSTDDSVAIAESYRTKIIQSPVQGGAASARNRGAETAQGDVLLFVDADVEIYPDSLDIVAEAFAQNLNISAIFGSYDDKPGCSNFFSQYKNLFHHYIHQTSREDASTFWSGCGAIKKEVFFEIGKFDETYKKSSIEDIALGYKLKLKNHEILLVKKLIVKHLKPYSFISLVKSDFFDRAIPWTVLMLNNKQLANDLNLKVRHKLSAMLLFFILVFILLSFTSTWFALPSVLSFMLLIMLNYDLYEFFLKKRGTFFTFRVVPLHLLYYFYSTLGFTIGYFKHLHAKNSLVKTP